MRTVRTIVMATAVLGSFVMAMVACGGAPDLDDDTFPPPTEGQTSKPDAAASRSPSDHDPGAFGEDAGDAGAAGDADCNPNTTAIVRDFKMYGTDGGHPDFEHFSGGGTKNLVRANLGADRKPVLNTSMDYTSQITSPASFAQWYRDTPGVNIPIEFPIPFKTNAKGISTFSSDDFFPIDNKGFGNQGEGHNFSFTLELHTEFKYKGGESFKFMGDDDVWTFINGKLAVDLGGLHSSQTGSVKVDDIAKAFGMTIGETYPLDVFQAERHTSGSHFRIDTTITFTNCAPIIVH